MISIGPESAKEIAEDMIQMEDTADVLICSFRYALGRKSYITEVIARVIAKYAEFLSDFELGLIIKEIYQADKEDNIGMDMDRKVWMDLAITLTAELAVRDAFGEDSIGEWKPKDED